MASITCTQVFDIAPEVLWDELRQISRHVMWMHDALSITFIGDQREGVGTTFLCKTRVGPFVTRDTMVITEWVSDHSMSVEHRGLIRGEGTFRVTPHPTGSELTWREDLRFPWWLGGRLGSWMAVPILRAIWRSNLRALTQVIAENGR